MSNIYKRCHMKKRKTFYPREKFLDMCFEDDVTNINYETVMKIIGRGRELYGYDIWDDVRRLSDYWPYRISKSVVEYLEVL